jgi:dihydrolipoamide dehydrogenase
LQRNIVIIGGGPGGYVAAIRAAQLGAQVTLIEKDRLGGTCLNWGCIPTKALYQNAQVIHALTRSAEFGVVHSGFTIDMAKVQERKERVVTALRDGIAMLLHSHQVEHIVGEASFAAAHELIVRPPDGEPYRIEAGHIIIATGSVPQSPAIKGSLLPGVVSSNELQGVREIPKSLVVIGGGVIGMEFAGIFNSFGTAVTVVEFMPRMLHQVDKDIVSRLSMALRRAGVRVQADVRVQAINQTDDGQLEVVAEGQGKTHAFTAEKVLLATGRSINVEGLNLAAIGVDYDRRGIKVDKHFATTVPGVYAIGDVIGGHMLAHVASEEGKACVEGILGLPGHVNYDCVPAVVFTSPEIATVGLTEAEAEQRGIPVSVSKFMLGANSKAVAMGEEMGLVKVIAHDQSKEVLGVHVLGSHASTLIHEAALAVEHKLTVNDIARTIHAHPTISEAFLEAVLGVEDRAIHTAPRVRRG